MKNNYMYPNIEAERIRMGLSQTEIISCLGYKERKPITTGLKAEISLFLFL